MIPLALRFLLPLGYPEVAVCRQTRQGIPKLVAVLPRGVTITGPIRELWLEYVMSTPHSFVNIPRADNRIMVV
jgi:hypothetical protein